MERCSNPPAGKMGSAVALISSRKQTVAFMVLLMVLASPIARADVWKEVTNNTQGICFTFVEPLGSYQCKEFSVPTEDGFLLGVQKVSSTKIAKAKKDPVFMYHGIMQGGDVWLLNSPSESLAFLLADSGHDVFIGNTRSSNFSYGHKTYSRSDKEFWDWTWDDLVDHDLPSMLQFVHDQTNETLLFVGFSQGTMTAFASFTQSSVVSLVKKAVMLSPIAYLRHVTAPLLEVAAWLFADEILLLAGVYEFSVENEGGRRFTDMVCKSAQLKCYDGSLLSLITGPNCCMNTSRMPYYTIYEVQSTSMKNIAQMAQLVRSGGFSRFDYGLFGNLAHYRSIFPSSYDLSAIPADLPIMLAHGGQDTLADKVDVSDLIASLQGDPQVILVPEYAHGDFVLALNATTEVYDKVLNFFNS
ncbi:hypothetical protein O6H91_17G028900 [Diphasiastrum complanatum]|uniref:Uncharacterized protein n=1 Tax=Diphasiastrum complanatum TaxID=34168 RepID=A0ACC2B5E5_DIPCM|nr:hypothetical protein O6H91_17G028900 [Diphasiastrum complanatum]